MSINGLAGLGAQEAIFPPPLAEMRDEITVVVDVRHSIRTSGAFVFAMRFGLIGLRCLHCRRALLAFAKPLIKSKTKVFALFELFAQTPPGQTRQTKNTQKPNRASSVSGCRARSQFIRHYLILKCTSHCSETWAHRSCLSQLTCNFPDWFSAPGNSRTVEAFRGLGEPSELRSP